MKRTVLLLINLLPMAAFCQTNFQYSTMEELHWEPGNYVIAADGKIVIPCQRSYKDTENSEHYLQEYLFLVADDVRSQFRIVHEGEINSMLGDPEDGFEYDQGIHIAFFDGKHVAAVDRYQFASWGKMTSCYVSDDGGRSFIKVPVDSSQLYCEAIEYNEHGELWLANESEPCIYYSPNFGHTFRKICIDDTIDGIAMVRMHESRHGVVIPNHYTPDIMFVTNDNFRHYKKINTPVHDSLVKYEPKHYPQYETNGFWIWGDYYIIQQNYQFFYTKRSRIRWRSFDVPIYSLAVSHDTLVALLGDGRIVRFLKPSKYEVIAESSDVWGEITVRNGDIYVCGCNYGSSRFRYGLRKIGHGEDYSTPIYVDTCVVAPYNVIGDRWGFAWNIGAIYVKENGMWRRDTVLPMDIFFMAEHSDSTVVLNFNKLYNKNTKQLTPFRYDDFIGDFFDYPITEIVVTKGARHIFTGMRYKGTYNDTADVVNTLKYVNSHLYDRPPLSEFNITEADLQEYRGKYGDDALANIGVVLDTLSDSLFQQMMYSSIVDAFGESDYVFLRLNNQHGDTLTVYGHNTIFNASIAMPFQLKKGNHRLVVSSVRLRDLFLRMMPDTFSLSNVALIDFIADKLSERRVKIGAID